MLHQVLSFLETTQKIVFMKKQLFMIFVIKILIYFFESYIVIFERIYNNFGIEILKIANKLTDDILEQKQNHKHNKNHCCKNYFLKVTPFNN